MAERDRLRRELRARRRTLSCQERRAAARSLARNGPLAALLGRYGRVALYLANDGEIDPAQLLTRLRAAGHRCYLPVLHCHRRQPLWFAHYLPGMPMGRNRFAIPEPQVPPGARLRAAELDALLMPLVGFDDRGNRLGMGGGFYDRSLQFLGHRRRWRKPLLIGLAYELQRLDRVEARDWDIPLDAVATEAGLYRFR